MAPPEVDADAAADLAEPEALDPAAPLEVGVVDAMEPLALPPALPEDVDELLPPVAMPTTPKGRQSIHTKSEICSPLAMVE